MAARGTRAAGWGAPDRYVSGFVEITIGRQRTIVAAALEAWISDHWRIR
jgi:hypothetical protein